MEKNDKFRFTYELSYTIDGGSLNKKNLQVLLANAFKGTFRDFYLEKQQTLFGIMTTVGYSDAISFGGKSF